MMLWFTQPAHKSREHYNFSMEDLNKNLKCRKAQNESVTLVCFSISPTDELHAKFAAKIQRLGEAYGMLILQ